MNIYWIALLALNVAIVIEIVRDYGKMKYEEGRLAELEDLISFINNSKKNGNNLPPLQKDVQKNEKGVISSKRAE